MAALRRRPKGFSAYDNLRGLPGAPGLARALRQTWGFRPVAHSGRRWLVVMARRSWLVGHGFSHDSQSDHDARSDNDSRSDLLLA